MRTNGSSSMVCAMVAAAGFDEGVSTCAESAAEHVRRGVGDGSEGAKYLSAALTEVQHFSTGLDDSSEQEVHIERGTVWGRNGVEFSSPERLGG